MALAPLFYARNIVTSWRFRCTRLGKDAIITEAAVIPTVTNATLAGPFPKLSNSQAQVLQPEGLQQSKPEFTDGGICRHRMPKS
jgi:hypothetical protein